MGLSLSRLAYGQIYRPFLLLFGINVDHWIIVMHVLSIQDTLGLVRYHRE